MAYYYKNRNRARTKTTGTTATDQAGAKDTDINIIISKFKITGQAPGPATAPMGGDFTGLPEDLRQMIETARAIQQTRAQLPQPLRDLPLDKLLTLTGAELKHIMKPPQSTEETTK